jgi:Ca-activated chloride channel family protein
MRNLLLTLVCGALLFGQPRVNVAPRREPKPPPARKPANLRLDVSMVLVPVSVVDSADRPVLDLPREQFRVFEDNIEQRIASFSFEEGPVSIFFVFDASSSMRTRMAASVDAIQRFLNTSAKGDEFAFIRFSDRPEVLNGFTWDTDQILRSVASVQPSGWTALQDAIVLAAQQMKTAHNVRRTLVVLTDGADNNSRYTEKEVRTLVRESDVRVYSIGMFERPRLLEDLASDSGGRAFWVHKLKELPDVIDRLSREMRSEYILGYFSTNSNNDGKFRKVRVEVGDSPRRTPLSIHWRGGYYAPTD